MNGRNLHINDISAEDLHRFAEMGRLSASLLHEISNPLTTALIHLDQMSEPSSQSIENIRRSLIRLKRYVNAARGQLTNQSNSKSFSVSSQVSDIKRLVKPVATANQVKLSISKVPGLKLRGDPLQFQQILVNLIINAIEAYANSSLGSKPRLVLVNFEKSKTKLVIRVVDNGTGIAKDKLAKVFEPFYSTKSGKGSGLGLGLVIVKSYVEKDFKGSISVNSSKKYTCFTIKMPFM